MILVSACLLGEQCKYSGGDNFSPAVAAYLEGKDYLPCCPEQLGGLPTPRPPAEIQGGSGPDVLAGSIKIINKEGQDVTAEFIQGAEAALALCHDAELAILKEGSPSCGVHRIYDGSFSGRKVPGCGVCAALLASKGVLLRSSEDLPPGEEQHA